MATRASDIVKDVKSYLAAGFVAIATWSLIVPSYLEHRDNQRLVRRLTAYLLLQDSLGVDEDHKLYVGLGNDGTLPETSSDYGGPLDPDGISKCDDGRPARAPPIMSPGPDHFYTLTCDKITVSSPERGQKPIHLSFRRKVGSPSEYVRAYFTVHTEDDTSLPFKMFGIVLASKIDEDDSEPPAEPGGFAGFTFSVPEGIARVPLSERRRRFAESYEFRIIQDGVAERVLQDNKNDAGNFSYELKKLIKRNSTEAIRARNPPEWPRLQELLLESGSEIRESSELKISSPAVQKLVAQYLRDDATYDVAGLKVGIRQVPLAISVVLLLLSCLLIGPLIAARRSRGVSLEDDAGWLFLQRYRNFGAAPVVASTLLLLLIVAFSGYVLFVSAAMFSMNVPLSSDYSVLILIILSTAAFTVISVLTLIAQWRIGETANTFEDNTG